MIFDDLAYSGLNANVVNGFKNAFVDKGVILKSILHDKRTTEDIFHINEAGYRSLVRSSKVPYLTPRELGIHHPQADYTTTLLRVKP